MTARSTWWGLLLVAALVSISLMVAAVTFDDRTLSMVGATGFVACAVLCALRLNSLVWPDAGASVDRAANLAQLNAGLLATAFIWGGAAILAGYYLTDLFWHHAWQYGLGMCLSGFMALGLRWHLVQTDGLLRQAHWLERLTWLSGLLAVGTTAGLVFLVASGKLARDNVDWLANHVFVAGGVSVLAIAVISVWSQLRRRG